MKKTKSLYHGHRFPASFIGHAGRRCFRFRHGLHDIRDPWFEPRRESEHHRASPRNCLPLSSRRSMRSACPARHYRAAIPAIKNTHAAADATVRT